MIQQTDRLVEDYLGAVSYACADLPPRQRDELIEDLREHIAAAREVLDQPTEAAIRTILDRLGEPAAIAEEARHGEPLGQPVVTSPPVREPASSPVPEPASVPVSESASVPEAEPASRLSSATLGMWLGFAFLVIVVLVVGALFFLQVPPPPPER